MEQRRNARTWETGEPRENPPTSRIVSHDSHIQNPVRDPAGNRIRPRRMLSNQYKKLSFFIQETDETRLVLKLSHNPRTDGSLLFSSFEIESREKKFPPRNSIDFNRQVKLAPTYCGVVCWCAAGLGCGRFWVRILVVMKRYRNEGAGKRDIPEKPHRTTSFGTISTCENPVTRSGIEPGSPWWEASALTVQQLWPQLACQSTLVVDGFSRSTAVVSDIDDVRRRQHSGTAAGMRNELEEKRPAKQRPLPTSVPLSWKSTTVSQRIMWVPDTGAGKKGRGKREIPEKTRRPTASSGAIPICENPVTRPGIEPGSPWWEASVLIAQPPLQHAQWPATPSLAPRAPCPTWRYDPGTSCGALCCVATGVNTFAVDNTDCRRRCGRARRSHGPRCSDPVHTSQYSRRNQLRMEAIDRRKPALARRAVLPLQGAHRGTSKAAEAIRTRGAVKAITPRTPPGARGVPWDYSPPKEANHFDSRRGRSRIFARGNRAGRCRWSADFLGYLQFPSPLHSGAAPYAPRFTNIGSQDLDYKSGLNLFNAGRSWEGFILQGRRSSPLPYMSPSRIVIATQSEAEYGTAPESKGGGKREILEKTHQSAASSGKISICENPGRGEKWRFPPGSGTGSPRWKASGLTITPPRPLTTGVRTYRGKRRFPFYLVKDDCKLGLAVLGTRPFVLREYTIDSKLYYKTVSHDFVIIGFSGLSPTMVANLKTYSRQKGYFKRASITRTCDGSREEPALCDWRVAPETLAYVQHHGSGSVSSAEPCLYCLYFTPLSHTTVRNHQTSCNVTAFIL
ncbi:hypothetical protein PR048_028806 [Dryococelus australis]|uniref:Uncharacterized protein n=1 Tax=Dryococelus australis TaxID=614101 RepID=A0ABQ9GBL1_9NEOP|nr:hypothetical protein PR048_028806 [Dryococelus australis]